jgi:hypothetical protein
MRIGVTGHLNLTPATVDLVRADLRLALGAPLGAPLGAQPGTQSGAQSGVQPGATGVTCLARGADTVFAEVVLELGGTLEVVLPCDGYGEAMVPPEQRARFEELCGAAETVRVMPFRRPSRQAYEAANRYILNSCDRLIAVWDGLSAEHRGGTGAFVAEARARLLPVDVRWPAGAAREP